MRTLTRFAAVGVLAPSILATGCSSVQLRYPDGTIKYLDKTAFAAYIEQIFRYQNRVIDDLIVADSLLEDTAAELDPRLVRAEEGMEEACQPLIDVVNARIEGRELGFFEKLQLPTMAPACEAATRKLEGMLGASQDPAPGS